MTLEETYYEINQILGSNAEPLESVLLVEEYRRYLKPETVRVVLLAESHVFTSDGDRRIAIPPIDDMPGYPTQYARFVYCLGCGERDLTNDPYHPRRDGTPQFWKVLYACYNRVENLEDFHPVQRGTPFPQRLRNKVNLLKNLTAKGIWLVDASIVALYRNGEKVPGMAEIIRKSWRLYTRQVVTSADPESVICVGKGVAKVVENDLQALFPSRNTVIPQPNARLSSIEHMGNYQRYYNICNP